MAELYPSDAELNALSGTSDAEQEVHFVTTGEAPYYTSFYKFVHRLLLMARRAGDLRVYKDGDLTFGVRAGKVQVGPTALDYAGCTGQSLTNNQTNYVFLTAADLAAGNTVTINTTGFPSDGTTFIPLATIATSAGDYVITDITDCRGRGLLNLPGGMGRIVEENTAGSGSPNVLIAAESGKVLTNEGSTATNYHTLPTAAAGLTFTFIRADASDEIRITAGAGDKIVVGTDVSIAAGYIESTAQWDTVTLIALDEEYWIAHPSSGTWTVETP